jgi:hypothetical protein
VTTSLNPAPPQQEVTFTATVVSVSPLGLTPTDGTVTFMDGNQILGTVPVIDGQATLKTSALTLGKHAIKAVFSGDEDFLTSTSAALTERIL